LLSRDLFVKTVAAVTEIFNTWKSNLWSVTHIRYLITGNFCNYGVFQSNSEGVVMFVFLIGDNSLFQSTAPRPDFGELVNPRECSFHSLIN
jgi:hypothetical protein